ncbi:hypothetical protein [Proteus phage VTCCBPA139]|nr:hypothetical protein [Proteus phage VTCCBPA139]
MGVVNLGWYEENNIPFTEVVLESTLTPGTFYTKREYATYYCCGRIDVDDDTTFGSEISVPVMDAESWNSFSDFLWDLETENPIYDLKELERLYTESTGLKINWFKEQTCVA